MGYTTVGTLRFAKGYGISVGWGLRFFTEIAEKARSCAEKTP